MKLKKPTVSIGIPAYNEEANIKNLLLNLLGQKTDNFVLEEIIIVSDGSSDGTVLKAKSISDKRIKIIDRKQRLGILKTQNEIVENIRADILILLDADVIPANDFFLKEIIMPIIKKKAHLVGADTVSTNPETFFEKVISASHQFKTEMYKKIRNQNNIYLCHGRARAFSKKLYPVLKWPDSPPEDAYSYLYCVKKGFKFAFAPKAQIIFRSPATLKDHFRQSSRFFIGRNQMLQYFSQEFVRSQYRIPPVIFLKTYLKHLLRNPFTLSLYTLIVAIVRLTSFRKKIQKATWDIAASSKKIIYEKT